MLIAISAPARSIEATAMSISRPWMTSRIGTWSTSTSYIERSTLSGSTPWLIVRFPCGSRSMARTSWPDSANATARFKVVVVLATTPFWFANEMIFARRSDWSPMWAPGGRPIPGRRTGASACLALILRSSSSWGSGWFTGGLVLTSVSTGSGSGSGSGVFSGSGSEGVGSVAGGSSITSASGSRSGSGLGGVRRSTSLRSASVSRFGAWPFDDHSSPDRGTSDLEPRLKRPIDRDYSHALPGFLLLRCNDRGDLPLPALFGTVVSIAPWASICDRRARPPRQAPRDRDRQGRRRKIDRRPRDGARRRGRGASHDRL